jgi:hypothetical protein
MRPAAHRPCPQSAILGCTARGGRCMRAPSEDAGRLGAGNGLASTGRWRQRPSRLPEQQTAAPTHRISKPNPENCSTHRRPTPPPHLPLSPSVPPLPALTQRRPSGPLHSGFQTLASASLISAPTSVAAAPPQAPSSPPGPTIRFTCQSRKGVRRNAADPLPRKPRRRAGWGSEDGAAACCPQGSTGTDQRLEINNSGSGRREP